MKTVSARLRSALPILEDRIANLRADRVKEMSGRKPECFGAQNVGKKQRLKLNRMGSLCATEQHRWVCARRSDCAGGRDQRKVQR